MIGGSNSVNYQTKYQSSPSPDESTALVKYITRGSKALATLTSAGLDADERDIEGFRLFATSQSMARLHTISFSQEFATDDLAERAHSVARNHLDGEWLLTVHDGISGHKHLHIAQAGSKRDCTMDTEDIKAFRTALVNQFPNETIGTDSEADDSDAEGGFA